MEIENINAKYSEFEIDFSIRLSDRNINNCFYRTLEKVKEKYDSDRFYKALFENDEFALVIYGIMNYNFDKVKFKRFTQKVATQLSFSF